MAADSHTTDRASHILALMKRGDDAFVWSVNWAWVIAICIEG
jgi:hypothetical protein